ncbi:hypothetical protein VTK73DRAFT_3312 [Phialemonium thermophilum]|uniref:Trafficking protein particle complex subunit 13 n=1 Tax=Phialemonium thermophilum TaxID=223376 RepID=A0ABR3Y289_9PEZI
MSHQRYPSHDVKEPHSVSLKVLRLSRPSLVAQYPLEPPLSSSSSFRTPPVPASLAYKPSTADTNPEPFVLSPILNLPPSFGSAYVGETFSCTLCVNHDVPESPLPPTTPDPIAVGRGGGTVDTAAPFRSIVMSSQKSIRDVRIQAEMKTPGSADMVKLRLKPDDGEPESVEVSGDAEGSRGVDLDPGQTLQKVVNFDLKEEGHHVLAVTVSYYEATATSGRTRTFRKLYQFVCKSSLIVRTKPGQLPSVPGRRREGSDAKGQSVATERRRWVLEAQLENCGEDVMQLERVVLDLEPGLTYRDCNWEASGGPKPVLHPGEVEQVCFIVEQATPGFTGADSPQAPPLATGVIKPQDGRIVFGVLEIGWRSEMGNRGFLSTGKLGTRPPKS